MAKAKHESQQIRVNSKYSIPAAVYVVFFLLAALGIVAGLFLFASVTGEEDTSNVWLAILTMSAALSCLAIASLIYLLMVVGQNSDEQIRLLQELLRHARVTAQYSAEANAVMEVPGKKARFRPVGSDLQAEAAAEEVLGYSSSRKVPQAVSPPGSPETGQKPRLSAAQSERIDSLLKADLDCDPEDSSRKPPKRARLVRRPLR